MAVTQSFINIVIRDNVCKCLVRFVPESPRWLYGKGRTKEANAILVKMGKFNGKPLSEKLELTPQVKKTHLRSSILNY